MKKKVADSGVKAKSQRLAGRRIAWGVCGGIAAVETVKAIRELRRHGARVSPFFTPSVEQFISEMAVAWAADESVTSTIGAEVDHLEDFDLVVVAPATLNTIAKAAVGIADNAVTLLLAGQLGRRAPVLFVPTMNLALQKHPAFAEHAERLERWGAEFFSSPVEEDRIKMPGPDALAAKVLEMLK
jgi:phosphopantothenoylcysteine decarboxylase/phosphopantothenate--cysteine ligase